MSASPMRLLEIQERIRRMRTDGAADGDGATVGVLSPGPVPVAAPVSPVSPVPPVSPVSPVAEAAGGTVGPAATGVAPPRSSAAALAALMRPGGART